MLSTQQPLLFNPHPKICLQTSWLGSSRVAPLCNHGNLRKVFTLETPIAPLAPRHVKRKPATAFSTSCSLKNADGSLNASSSTLGKGVDRDVRFSIEVSKLNLSVNKDAMKVPILRDCSVSIPEGQLWMLLGPNGCGKSTLLKVLAGILKPNSGQFFIAEPRSFVFQNPDHQVVMPTAEADVAFGLGQFNLPENEVRLRVARSLQAVGMAEYIQRPVQTLSGGQKQRVAIAGALAEASRVLLLDELTTFLDESDQMGVIQAVRNVVGGPQAVTALWVTHRLEELEYADGAIYMENGTVAFSGEVIKVKEYIQRKQDDYRRSIGLLL